MWSEREEMNWSGNENGWKKVKKRRKREKREWRGYEEMGEFIRRKIEDRIRKIV